jgi:hypothetical protein
MKEMLMRGIMTVLCQSGSSDGFSFCGIDALERSSPLAFGSIDAFSKIRKELWCFVRVRRCGEEDGGDDVLEAFSEVAEVVAVAIDAIEKESYGLLVIEIMRRSSRPSLKYVLCAGVLRAVVTTCAHCGTKDDEGTPSRVHRRLRKCLSLVRTCRHSTNGLSTEHM